MPREKIENSETQVLVYQTDDGTTRVEVRMTGETVWLNQNQMADLFQTTQQNVGQHTCNVFAEGKLASEPVVRVILPSAAESGLRTERTIPPTRSRAQW